METARACLPCFLRQAEELALLLGIPAGPLRETASGYLEGVDLSLSPPEIAAGLHRLLQKKTGVPDPYHRLKRQYNELALSWYDNLKARVRAAADPLAAAVRLAIAGNIIDFGVKGSLGPEVVAAAVEECREAPLDEVLLEQFRQKVREAGSILYIGDNCGEVVFDRILIEELPLDKVVYAVRGVPVLNDITREDAAAAGIPVRVIDNGTDAPGTPLDSCSAAFLDACRKAGLVIAKGQGNFETLLEREEEIFFLFRVKCPLVAELSGLPQGSLAFMRGPVHSRPKSSSSRSMSSSPK